MFRPTQALFKRFRKLRLTTKDINKGFYKGTRTGKVGNHDKHGGYRIDFKLVRHYVVPKNLNEFKLTPFVTNNVRRKTGAEAYTEYGMDGPRSPQRYLDMWKMENGLD
ncbi:60S ribosomal protein L27, mitochondrial [Gnomoniopsis sp. IMI 355080]|nr:60S ribosomal protein L27, mitochondrial [Gnomoniopsis sp. IMI 355080]